MLQTEQLSLYQAPNHNGAENTPVPVQPGTINGRLNEIHLSGNSQLARTLLAGVAVELSSCSDERWFCWVGQRPLKPLIDAGASLRGQRILQVMAKQETLCQIACRALERGRSHTVAVLVERKLDRDEQTQLALAAAKGEAECLIIHLH